MQHPLMAIWSLCYTTCYTTANQQRDKAKAAPAESWYTPEISRYECLKMRRVHSTYAYTHSHEPLVQVTMDTEHKLDEYGDTNSRTYGGP
jgi:hypothetical protein